MCEFKVLTDEESNVVDKIMRRIASLDPGANLLAHRMDISACMVNVPMDLQRLLDADNFNFMHDIFGINNNLDHSTGELMNCFHPRFATN